MDTFENVLGQFENSEVFPFFWNFSTSRPSRVQWTKNFNEITSKHVWTLLGTFLDTFEISNCFRFFFEFFQVSTLQGALGTFFFEKKPQNKFKTCLDTFGNVFGYLEFWEIFAFLWNFSTSLHSRVHWPKNLEKITSKHVWTILETFLDIFENLNSFRFLWNFFQSPGCTGQSFFSVEIIMQNMIKQCFWERFWRILKVSKFFHFFVFFASFDHPGCTGQKFLPKKLPLSMLKTCLIAFGNVFSGNLNKWNFFQFFEVYPSFGPPGCTGQEKIEKITSSKFGHFLKRFSGFWNFEIFLIFVNFSWVSRVHWAQRFPSKKSIKTFSGNVFGNVFGRFWKFQSFSFF